MDLERLKQMMEKSKNESVLWELREQEENSKCADCTDSFPRYMNTTFGTFVCSVCGAIQVKSLTSDKFTDEEVDKLKGTGNKKAQDVWMAKWNAKEMAIPLPSDEKKVREFIKLKYVERKWRGYNPVASEAATTPATAAKSPPHASSFKSPPPPVVRQTAELVEPASSSNERKANVNSKKSIAKDTINMSTSADSAPSLSNGGAPFNPFRPENAHFNEKPKDSFPPFSKQPFDQHSYLKEKSSFYSKVTIPKQAPRTPPTSVYGPKKDEAKKDAPLMLTSSTAPIGGPIMSSNGNGMQMLSLPGPNQGQGLFNDLMPTAYQPQPGQQLQLTLPASFIQQSQPMPQPIQQQQQFQPQYQQQQMVQQPQQQSNVNDMPLDELFGLKIASSEPIFPSSGMSFESGNSLDYDEDQNSAWRDLENKKRQYLKDHELALQLQKEENSRPAPTATAAEPIRRSRSKTDPPPFSNSSSGSKSSRSSSSGTRNRASSFDSPKPE
eukprot:gene4392-5139_t